jgi:predicted transcriptional regulator
VHIISPGFTTKVFVNNSAPLVRIGVDKLVMIHCAYPDQKTEKDVQNVIESIEKYLKMKSTIITLREKTFSGLINEIHSIIEGFGQGDEIYLHLEGGERHVGLAMTYASFFVRRKIKLVFATEYGSKDKEYRFEMMPPIPPYDLTKKQMEILKLVADTEGQTLTELSGRINEENPKNIAPAVLRQLKALSELNLIMVDQNGKKTYTITASGRLFL